MKLNKHTLGVLTMFSSISPNLLLTPGNSLRTVNESKTIVATATLPDTFPSEFGIYELGTLLQALSLQNYGEIEFGASEAVITNGKSKLVFKAASKKSLNLLEKDPAIPEGDLNFTLTEDVLGKLRKASTVLKCPELEITKASDKSIMLTMINTKNPAQNTFSIEIDAIDVPDEDFRYVFMMSNLVLMDGDHQVNVGSAARFVTETTDGFKTTVFVAREKPQA